MLGKELLHLAKYYLGIECARTQTSGAERNCLVQIARSKNRVVEIGVFEGVTTKLLSENMSRSGRLYAVDPFITGRLGICWSQYIANAEAKNSQYSSNVEFVQSYSYDAVMNIDGDFDMIFIDGDHSLQGIKRDWADWSGRIIKGGIIALHDTRVPSYNKSVEMLGSYQYFESHIRHDERFDLVEQIDSLSVLQRV